MQLDDLVLVSVDDHVVEPPDMFEGHLPARCARRRAPRVERRTDGSDVWVYDGNEIPNIGLNAVAGRPPEEYGMEPTSFDEIRVGLLRHRTTACATWTPTACSARCASRRSPTCAGSCSPARPTTTPAWPSCGPTTTGTSTSGAAPRPGRFIPLMLPPIWDPELMADEVRRVRGQGLPRRVVLGEPVQAASCPASTTTTGTRSGRRASTRDTHRVPAHRLVVARW